MAEKNMNAKISVEFEETANRQQLSSGDNLPALFGKIKKFFTDLKTVCFSGSYNDLSDKPTTATTDTDGLMSAEDKTKLDGADDTYALKAKYGDTTINVGRLRNSTVGRYSTAEGTATTASAFASHAEGQETIASGENSHAEGYKATASSKEAHAEGGHTTASGRDSHAEGYYTTASGDCSHAGGVHTKALHYCEVAHGKYNESNDDTLFSIGDGASDTARRNAFEITTTGGKLHDKDIATTDLIPTSLPANGGNADTVDNVHISCINDAVSNSNWFAAFTDTYNLRAIDPERAYVGNAGLLKPTLIGTAEHCTYHTILDWANSVNGMGQAVIVQGSGYPSDIPVGDEGLITVETDNENIRKVVTFKSYGSGRGTYRRNIWNGGWRWDWVDIADADTLDGLHADDFVNANDKGQIQIPNNVNVPAWIYANGKRYKIYMTNGANIGMTNVPNNSTDFVWYWFDGINIIARVYASGKYYICDMINGGFSGWKDIYTSGYKPYVTGEEGCGDIVTATIKDYQIFNFTPSAVICQIANGSAFFATTIQNGFSVTLTPQHNGKILKYIAFK